MTTPARCAHLEALLPRVIEALERQTDNMAFVLNRVELYNWYDKFADETVKDRALLAELKELQR